MCLITGAYSGIGFATARALAERNATVRMLCRSEERGRRAVDEIRGATGNERVSLDLLDVSDLDQVRGFSENLAAEEIHVLVNNAGVLPAERALTEAGLEVTLATNLVGPVLLTELLLPRLRAAGSSAAGSNGSGHRARVIYVSSGGMYTQRLNLARLEGKTGAFDGTVAYAQTKRAMAVVTEAWAEREPGVVFHGMHPGWADTPAVRTSLPRFYRLLKNRLRTPEEGADTVVWLAVAEAAANTSGGYWFDRAPAKTHKLPWTRERDQDRRALLTALGEWTGLGDLFPEPAAP